MNLCITSPCFCLMVFFKIVHLQQNKQYFALSWWCLMLSLNVLYEHWSCYWWVTVFWTACCVAGSCWMKSFVYQLKPLKVEVSLTVPEDEIVLHAGVLSINIHTTKKQFRKQQHTSYPVQLKGKPVCYDTIKSMAHAQVMQWLMWVMMSLDWSLVCWGVWKMGNPWEVLLSQTHTVAWECSNDSQYSQTHLSSCQGPIESVKLHQQV